MVDIEKYELGKGLTDEQLSTLVSTLAAGWAIYLLASSPGRFQIRSIFYKIRLTLSVVSHIFLSRDRSWSAKKVIDSGVISGGPYTAVKTVFFIRHGKNFSCSRTLDASRHLHLHSPFNTYMTVHKLWSVFSFELVSDPRTAFNLHQPRRIHTR